MLSLPARQAIFRSMALQMVSGGTTIISQGDTDATKFYVLEKGTCDVLISSDATGNVLKKVHTYTSGRYSTLCPMPCLPCPTFSMAHRGECSSAMLQGMPSMPSATCDGAVAPFGSCDLCYCRGPGHPP